MTQLSDTARLPSVAFQGAAGAFGEEAISLHWRAAGGARPLATPSFDQAIERARSGVADFAVVPVWNSIVGPVIPARAALARVPGGIRGFDHEAHGPLEAVAEIELPVRQHLLSLPGAQLDGLTHVGSHPVALAQCGRFFKQHPRLRAVPAYDTAGAAEQLAAFGQWGPRAEPSPNDQPSWWTSLDRPTSVRAMALGAVASEAAAAHYGLRVLVRDIHDDPANMTRFLVLRRCEPNGESADRP